MTKQYYLLGIIICLAIALAALPIRLAGNDDIQAIGVLKIISYTFSVCLLSYFLHFYLSNRKNNLAYSKNKYGYSFVSILLVAVITLPVDTFFDYVFALLKHSTIWFDSTGVDWILLTLRSLLISSVIFFVVFYLKLLEERQQRNLEIERLKQAQLEANLSNLKEQMNPHFLFNTLNTLISITSEKHTKDYVSELANVYRYMLVHNKMNIVTLSEELDFTKSYLYIIKARMASSININISIDDIFLRSKMPPLTLQLLVENAIKHNVTSNNYPLKIAIYNDSDYVVVSNSRKPKNSTQYSTGVGLHNLMNRYDLLFSQAILIEPSSVQFTVKLPIIKS